MIGIFPQAGPWDGRTPYDDDCTCTEDDLYTCQECGAASDTSGTGECEDPACELVEATDEQKIELRPERKCPHHGWCGGCTSPKCEDCAP